MRERPLAGSVVTGDLSLPFEEPARCCQSIGPDRSARVDAGRADADLGAEAVAEPVAKPCAAIKEHVAGIDQVHKLRRFGCVFCYDAVGMAGTVFVDVVDRKIMADSGEARPSKGDAMSTSEYVDCGKLLPGFEFSILDDNGVEMENRHCGHIHLKGPSVMRGYFHDEESTSEVLSEDGWLNTGDIGYRIDDHLVITSRSKDVIIIKGRNIWPYDLEVLAQETCGVKLGGVAAFSVSLNKYEEQAVLVVETKEKDADSRLHIIEDINRSIHAHFGINVLIDLTPRGTLPRTSSGKLSRSQSKQDYLARKTLLDVENSTIRVGDTLPA